MFRSMIVLRTRWTPSPLWGEGWGEGVIELSIDLNPSPSRSRVNPSSVGEGADRTRRAAGGQSPLITSINVMLQVDSIDLHYGAAQALRNVSLAAEAGKVTCVLGRNGVGKTSLLDALAGQHSISKGAITSRS